MLSSRRHWTSVNWPVSREGHWDLNYLEIFSRETKDKNVWAEEKGLWMEARKPAVYRSLAWELDLHLQGSNQPAPLERDNPLLGSSWLSLFSVAPLLISSFSWAGWGWGVRKSRSWKRVVGVRTYPLLCTPPVHQQYSVVVQSPSEHQTA